MSRNVQEAFPHIFVPEPTHVQPCEKWEEWTHVAVKGEALFDREDVILEDGQLAVVDMTNPEGPVTQQFPELRCQFIKVGAIHVPQVPFSDQ